VKGIIFLGTPHRGADLAELLSNILTAMLSQRIYVNQLRRESEMIQEINQAFLERSVALKLVSFYESTAIRVIGVNHLKIRQLTLLDNRPFTVSYFVSCQ
jgi:hypothetical protein